MIQFTTIIEKFEEQGEKTGWTYIEIPAAIAQQLKPNNKRTFRVKGLLDHYAFEGVALFPRRGGSFIMPLNATVRKGIRKQTGATLEVKLQIDQNEIKPPAELLECLADEPEALAYFKRLPKSHQNYFTKWINSAKGEATKAKRIAQSVTALSKEKGFGEMLRELKNNKSDY